MERGAICRRVKDRVSNKRNLKSTVGGGSKGGGQVG